MRKTKTYIIEMLRQSGCRVKRLTILGLELENWPPNGLEMGTYLITR